MPPSDFAPFPFAGHTLAISASRAVYWPAQEALLVADLHLEKASWFAQRGQMLPPYDSAETLDRLAQAIAQTGARRVFCLGDNFHDDDGPTRMTDPARSALDAIAARVDLVWITGNHDAAMMHHTGAVVDEVDLGGVTLRHEAQSAAIGPEISGHYHPKLRLRIKGRAIRRPCALRSESRLILPAFGALTGGLDATDPALIAAMQPARTIEAIVHTSAKAVQIPVWSWQEAHSCRFCANFRNLRLSR
jgi:DNA ligase-associated metallophosphoesterase